MDHFASFHRAVRALLDDLRDRGELARGADVRRCRVVPQPLESRFDFLLDAALVHAREAAFRGSDRAWLPRTIAGELARLPEAEAVEVVGPGFVGVRLRAEARFAAVTNVLKGERRVVAGDGCDAGPSGPGSCGETSLAAARAAVLADVTASLGAAAGASPAGLVGGRRAQPRPGPVVVVRDGPAARPAPATHAEVVGAVGTEAFRIAVVAHRPDAVLRLDLAALNERSASNPAFWVPYAHARGRSVLRRAALALPGADLAPAALARVDLGPLTDPGDVALARLLARHPHAVAAAAAAGRPDRFFAQISDLADAVHSQWNRSKDQPQKRFVNEQRRYLSLARLALVTASALVLKSGLGILGVMAPDEMC